MPGNKWRISISGGLLNRRSFELSVLEESHAIGEEWNEARQHSVGAEKVYCHDPSSTCRLRRVA